MRQAHLAHQTGLTRTGKVNMLNRKPYRTATQKAEARGTAEKVGGTYVSNAPVSYHRAVRVSAEG
ncbi:hypothetical protein [Agrobacterium pusense]|uniref:hypothetical protein n=1 Tax=Agrobacterium pusense TaxID=648995 RepID=UPI002FE15221